MSHEGSMKGKRLAPAARELPEVLWAPAPNLLSPDHLASRGRHCLLQLASKPTFWYHFFAQDSKLGDTRDAQAIRCCWHGLWTSRPGPSPSCFLPNNLFSSRLRLTHSKVTPPSKVSAEYQQGSDVTLAGLHAIRI